MGKKDNWDELDKEMQNQSVWVSKKHKKKMNRIFREYYNETYIPYPEVDNWLERVKSFIAKELLN